MISNTSDNISNVHSINESSSSNQNKNHSFHHRLFKHDTINSISRRIKIKSIDSLDIILSAAYNHETDLFSSKYAIVLQPENRKCDTEWTTLDMNTKRMNYLNHPLVIGRNHIRRMVKIYSKKKKKLIQIFSYIGGVSEKRSPHSVKLICSGQHTPYTNPGYSRQPVDGNIFNY